VTDPRHRFTYYSISILSQSPSPRGLAFLGFPIAKISKAAGIKMG